MTSPRRAAAAVALALCVLVPHWPAGRVDFVYDDEDFIVSNPAAHSLSAAAAAALRPFPPGQPGRRLYRPVTALSYGADYALWRGSARGFALTNLALYLAVTLLAWRFLASWLSPGRAAFAAALLFAVHPVHTEAVDAIAGRSELLALLFALLAVRLFPAASAPGAPASLPAGTPSPRAFRLRSAASALAYALACGAKETAVVLPAVLAALAAARLLGEAGGGAHRRRAALSLLPHLLVLAGYLLLRRSVLGGLAPVRSPLEEVDLAGRVLAAGPLFLEYLRLLVFPAALHVDGWYLTGIGIATGPTARSLIGLGLLAALLGGAAALVLRLARPGSEDGADPRRALLAGLGILLVFLLPVSQLVPIGALMAERFLFAPSLGFALAAAAVGQLLWRSLAARLSPRGRRAALAGLACALGALAALGGWRSHARAAEWRDAVRFWEVAERDLPGSYLVKTNLAAELMQRGDLAGAEERIREALEIRPGAPEATHNLSLILRAQGRHEDRGEEAPGALRYHAPTGDREGGGR